MGKYLLAPCSCSVSSWPLHLRPSSYPNGGEMFAARFVLKANPPSYQISRLSVCLSTVATTNLVSHGEQGETVR